MRRRDDRDGAWALVHVGYEVLEAHREHPYNIILMDVQMPVMDGLEATRRIRSESPVGAQPKIVAMTAGVTELDRSKCLQSGMDGFIRKPMKIDDLRMALEEALGISTNSIGLN